MRKAIELTLRRLHMRKVTFRTALRQALQEELLRDERVYIIGEDVGAYRGGGIYGVTKGLQRIFGKERVIDTPISEGTIIGSSVGSALMGMRPVAEIMFSELLSACFEQLVYEAPRMRFFGGDAARVPLVVRTPFGAREYGYQFQTESPEAWYVHVPGLKVVVPSTPYDAKGLLKMAIRDDNPVLFLEHKKLYDLEGDVPEEEYTIPFGKADIKREGQDVTIIATAWMVHQALSAARVLDEDGIDCEIIDPRTLVPLDTETILGSVRKTGRVIIVHEASKTGGVGGEISAILAEEAFSYLDAPILRVAAPDVPVSFPPSQEDIMEAVRKVTRFETAARSRSS